MQYKNTPIICDFKYTIHFSFSLYSSISLKLIFQEIKILNRYALHSKELELIHPYTCKRLTFSLPVENSVYCFLSILRKDF